MAYLNLQRCQQGEINDIWDFNVVNGQHGKGIYCFFANDIAMKNYYCKNNENLHTFKIDDKYVIDLSKKNLDYWDVKSFIYNNPQYKAFIFNHSGHNIPTSKEILITDPSIIILNDNIKNIIKEEILLFEELNKISLQNAVDQKMFGPVYHGTTEENREKIEKEGFKIFMGTNNINNNIRHGYPGEINYAEGIPPPIHHLGYGIYFTTSKSIAKRFNVNSGKGIKSYYLNVPRLEIINFASPKKMMDWWITNGYDPELAKQGQNGRIEATKKLTNKLKEKYDGVWFKGKTIYKTLDGDQIVVFNTNNIYQIDTALAGEMEIGSKVQRTEDKFDYNYNYNTETGQHERTIREKPTIIAGTIGIIMNKIPAEPMRQHWKNIGNTNPHWTEGSEFVYSVKWNKGGTENNILDKHIKPYNKHKKIKEVIKEEIQSLYEGIHVYHGSDRKFDEFDINKVGSGDGKSLGGWGLYFSDDENVSRRYATSNGFVGEYELRNGNYFDLDEIINDGNRIISQLQKYGIDENEIEEFKTDYLEYDATNKQVYDWLSYVLGGEKEASLFLNDLGYIGNTFIDKWEKNARNYVVFNTNNIIN